MDCADAKLRMEPCASGALVPEELALFEGHIATCEGCRLELELVRAMGSSKSGDGKPDDWTLDRIFGSPASRAVEGPATVPAEPAAAPANSAAPAAAPVESEPPDAGMLFETTPNPMPPESPQPTAPSPFSESNPTPPVSAEEPIAGPAMFDEPNPVSAMSADVPSGPIAAPPKAASAPAPRPAPPAPASVGAGSGNSWDFEPADAKPEASLPEGSLFFAEETLARRGDARKGQNAMKRMVIWGGGVLVGVALLALSLWVGFFARVEGPDQNLGSPGASTGQPAPSGGETPESLAPSSDGAVDSSAAVAPDVVTTPADEVVAQPPSAAHATAPGASKPLGARALSGGGVPPLSTPTRTGSQPVAPRSTSGAPAATSGKGNPKKPAVATTTGGATKPAATSSGTSPKPSGGAASPAPSRVVVTEELDPEQLELREPAPTPAPSERSVPFPAGSRGGDSGQAATPRKPASASPPASAVPAPADAGSGAPAADSVQRPIDRLHLATVAAEQGSDLVALRKVRDTWKGFVRTSVGPDRARAKRELADCLWAIQSLTGRTSDKKRALAAYREYLLNAPAGGSDPRTVARMRQLEDALTESK